MIFMSCWLLREAWEVLALGSHSSLARGIRTWHGGREKQALGSGRGLHTHLCDLTKANNAF